MSKPGLREEECAETRFTTHSMNDSLPDTPWRSHESATTSFHYMAKLCPNRRSNTPPVSTHMQPIGAAHMCCSNSSGRLDSLQPIEKIASSCLGSSQANDVPCLSIFCSAQIFSNSLLAWLCNVSGNIPVGFLREEEVGRAKERDTSVLGFKEVARS